MSNKAFKINPEYLGLADASLYCGLSVRTLRRLIVTPGGLPYYRLRRGKILLKKADIDSWLKAYKHEPIDLDVLATEALAEMRVQGV